MTSCAADDAEFNNVATFMDEIAFVENDAYDQTKQLNIRKVKRDS